MARRLEDVARRPLTSYTTEELDASGWNPGPEVMAQLEAARQRLDRGEGIPWREVRPRLRATIAAGDVNLRARAARGIPEGVPWAPPLEVVEEMQRAREAAYLADAVDDEVSDWEAPPGLLERIEMDCEALRTGAQKGMDWEEFEPVLLGWIAECGPLDDDAP